MGAILVPSVLLQLKGLADKKEGYICSCSQGVSAHYGRESIAQSSQFRATLHKPELLRTLQSRTQRDCSRNQKPGAVFKDSSDLPLARSYLLKALRASQDSATHWRTSISDINL